MVLLFACFVLFVCFLFKVETGHVKMFKFRVCTVRK